jgi:dTMP kinase
VSAPTHQFLTAMAGRFIVFEGPDGSGKSTQLRRFSAACSAAGVTVCEVREPGGTAIGEQIREILLHTKAEMTLRCEMMLYMASRSQLVEQRIRPALDAREMVLADRFVSSTLAYQGTAGGLPLDEIRSVAAAATGGISPDLVVIFDVDEATAAHRMSPLLDRIESRGMEFHRRVRSGYLAQAAADPQSHLVIDASKSPDEVWAALLQGLELRAASRRWLTSGS